MSVVAWQLSLLMHRCFLSSLLLSSPCCYESSLLLCWSWLITEHPTQWFALDRAVARDLKWTEELLTSSVLTCFLNLPAYGIGELLFNTLIILFPSSLCGSSSVFYVYVFVMCVLFVLSGYHSHTSPWCPMEAVRLTKMTVAHALTKYTHRK